MNQSKIILASSSPRRKDLLASLLRNFGMDFDVIPADINEVLTGGNKNPEKLARTLSKMKAEKIADHNDGIIIGADTIVVLNRKILGKPETKTEARKMLSLLSGKTHTVITGIYILNKKMNKKFSGYEKTQVKFRRISRKEIDFYISTGSPFDKAGAYGIQDDFGSTFITSIKGDFFNVVGLPIVKIYLGLKNFITFRGLIV